MRSSFHFTALILIGAAFSVSAQAQDLYGPDFGPKADRTSAPPVTWDRIKYGPKRWERVSFLKSPGGKDAPLVVTLGGATASGPTDWVDYRLREEGFAVARIGYNGETRADDVIAVATAISLLRKEAADRGLDPDRILLLGYGGASQLATLLATDPTWLEQAGVPFEAIRGVASVNGEAFDIPATLQTLPGHLKGPFQRIYPRESAEQSRLSPINHLAPPNAPAFLFMAAEDEPRIVRESKDASARFAAAGLTVREEMLPKWYEGQTKSYLLAEKDGSGQALLDFFRSAIAPPAVANAGSGGV